MISDIHLQNFRSYGDEAFEFTPSVNIIVGPNASGKTNLLESVLAVARGKSYRAKDIDLVKFNKPWARASAHINGSDERIIFIEVADGRAKKQFKINNQTFARLSLQKTLPVVLFEPNHLQILSGSPDLRRQYIDDLAEQILPMFGTVRRQYKRALSQRNTLLKNIDKRDSISQQLFVWNVRLSELGAQIASARAQLIDDIKPRLAKLYGEISARKDKVEIFYQTKFSLQNYATNLLRQLESDTELDILRGFTAHGPHREDLIINLNKNSIQSSASRGESRSIILALKIVELELLAEAHTAPPLLLLDDVFSELDGARRQALTHYLAPYQTFITTTDADVVMQHFSEDAHILPL